MHKVVSSTLELESYLSNPWVKSPSYVTSPHEPSVKSIQAIQRDMIGAMQKIVEWVEFKVAAKHWHPGWSMDVLPQRGRGRQWYPGAQIICRRCNQSEHLSDEQM